MNGAARNRRASPEGRLDAKTWFDRANQFEIVALTLGAPPFQNQVAFALAHIVLRAFSAELFLKCALEVEGTSAPRTHDLHLLFRKLSETGRRHIRKRWKLSTGDKLRNARKMATNSVMKKTPLTLDGALKEAADAFVRWRYLPREAYIGFAIMNFPLCVREYILTKHPEWRPESDQLALDE